RSPVRQGVRLDRAPHPPHEQPGIGRLLEDRASQPALTPDAQLSDDRTERLAGRRQVVLGSLAVQTCTAFQESRLLELTKALREQRRRHQRDSTLDVFEPFLTRERELAYHERRPPLGENLGCLSDGAELSVALHGRSMCASCSAIQLQILQ